MKLLSGKANDKKELILFTPERIDANNASIIDADFNECLTGEEFTSAVLDCINLKYISSAGLREILLFKKKFDNFILINVCPDVYEIFDMTGFSSILDIKKTLRKISIKGLKIIGHGYMSNVYRLDEDKIIKHFIRENDIKAITKERELAKEAFILGVPTVISYEIVQVLEGGYGVIFELVTSSNLCDLYISHPENYDIYTKKYLSLLKDINSVIVPSNSKLPNKHELPPIWLKTFKDKNLLSAEEYKQLEFLFSTIPHTRNLIHGDYHIKNCMIQGDELLLIDMETIGYGNIIFELAGIHHAYIGYCLVDPNNVKDFFGIQKEVAKKLYSDTINSIFSTYNEQEKAEVFDKIALFSFTWLAHKVMTYDPDYSALINASIEEVKRLLKVVKVLNLER